MRSWMRCRPTIEPAGVGSPRPQLPETAAGLIRRHLPITAVPSIPELRLHLAGPRSGLGRLLAREAAAAPPYWAHAWGGGLVLARYLLDHPDVVAGRRVLDLGCGSGLVAVAAARVRARAVAAMDVDPYAVAATELNAALNGVEVSAHLGDPLDGPVPDAGLVLVGDLFYEATLARRVVAFLDCCAAAGCAALIGDPGRTPLPRRRLRAIHTGVTPDFGSGREGAPAAVYSFVGR